MTSSVGYGFEPGVYYLATVVDHCVGKTKSGGAQWIGKLVADHRKVLAEDGEWQWQPISEQPVITAYLPLAYERSGTGARECGSAVQSLIDSLGWTPDPSRPFASLEEHKADGWRIQFTVKEDWYNNECRMRVANIYPQDYEGGELRHASAGELEALDAEWGATFRAKFGATQAAPPAKAASPAPAPAKIADEPSPQRKPYHDFLMQRHGESPESIKPWTEGLPKLKKKFIDAAPKDCKDVPKQWADMLAQMVGPQASDNTLTTNDMGAISLLIDNGHYPLPF